MADGFVFYRSYAEAIKKLPKEMQLESLLAIVDYALDEEEPEDPIASAILTLVKHDITRDNAKADRSRGQYKLFRQSVLERDGCRCAKCGSGENLEVHHIKPFSRFPELRFDADNGVTLCKACHLKAHMRDLI